MSDTIWTTRRPAQIATPETDRFGNKLDSNGYSALVWDMSYSPDWLNLPDNEGLPENLRGKKVKVECSCWLPYAPNPDANENNEQQAWLDQRTRWHLINLPEYKPDDKIFIRNDTLAVAEVVGKGWVVLDVGKERLSIIRSVAKSQGG